MRRRIDIDRAICEPEIEGRQIFVCNLTDRLAVAQIEARAVKGTEDVAAADLAPGERRHLVAAPVGDSEVPLARAAEKDIDAGDD